MRAYQCVLCSLLTSIVAASAVQESHLVACVDGDLQCNAADASYMIDNAHPNYDVQLLQREVTRTKHVDMNPLPSLLSSSEVLKQMTRLNHDVHGRVAGSATAASDSGAGSGDADGTAAAAASAHGDDGGTGTIAAIATAATAKSFKIPLVLHWTGKQASLEQLAPQIQENLKSHIEGNPWFQFRYWDDDACLSYIKKYFSQELVQTYQNPQRGPYGGAYRGDICRTAVLAREGGFYLDLDVQLNVPLTELIDVDTTFMNVRDSNAMFAAAPNCSILQRAVDLIIPWYQKYDSGKQTYWRWLGPSILMESLESECECTTHRFDQAFCPQDLQWECGHNQIRLYDEQFLPCDVVSEECPKDRQELVSKIEKGKKEATFLKFAYTSVDGKTLGWPRFAGCTQIGCGADGHVEEKTAKKKAA